jgi:pyridoxine 4-dehydrogenase
VVLRQRCRQSVHRRSAAALSGGPYQADTPRLEFCIQNGIPYLPFGSLGYGATDTPPAEQGQTAAQARLAWLLARSPVTVVIAGTSSVEHLEENIAAGAQ